MEERTLTLKELILNPKYRKMTISQLSDIINWEVDYKSYRDMPGCDSRNKAIILKKFFAEMKKDK